MMYTMDELMGLTSSVMKRMPAYNGYK